MQNIAISVLAVAYHCMSTCASHISETTRLSFMNFFVRALSVVVTKSSSYDMFTCDTDFAFSAWQFENASSGDSSIKVG